MVTWCHERLRPRPQDAEPPSWAQQRIDRAQRGLPLPAGAPSSFSIPDRRLRFAWLRPIRNTAARRGMSTTGEVAPQARFPYGGPAMGDQAGSFAIRFPVALWAAAVFGNLRGAAGGALSLRTGRQVAGRDKETTREAAHTSRWVT